MPIYQRNGKTYNIPDSEVEGFEKTYPDATQKYVANGRNYNIPVSERNGFISTYKDATPFDKVPSAFPEIKSDPPASVDSQRVDSVRDYKPTIQEKPQTDFDLKQVMDGPTDSERKKQERKRIEEQIMQQKLATGKGLKKAYQDHNRKEKEEDEQKGWFRKIVEGISESGRDARRGFPLSPVQTDEKIRNLHAAAESVGNAEELMNESKHKEETGIGAGVTGFGRGFWDKMAKLSTWDMGMLDMSKSTAVLNAAHKFDLNQPLTGEEETLLDAVALETAANGEFSGDLGRGYKAGSTTAESLPFMAEFMVNPATGTGKAVGKVAAKKIISNFGKEAAKSTIGKIARNSARVAGDVVGAGIMTGTTGAMRTAADAVDRTTGDVKPIVDGDGYYRFGGTEEGDGALEAFVKAYGASTIENFSEMFGNYLIPIGSAIGAGVGKVMNKIGLGKVNEIIGNIKSSDIAKVIDDFQSKTQWNGTIGEYLEEQAGMAMNALTVGDNSLSDMIDPDTQIDTFLGVSAMGGLFSSVKTAGYAKEKYSARKKLNEADRFAADPNVIGEEWAEIKEWIDQADDSELVSVLSETMANENISDKGKQAVLVYAGRLKAYHGASLADLKRKTEGDTPDEVVQSQMNFDEGYRLAEVDRTEKRNALRQLEKIREKLDMEFLLDNNSERYNLTRQRADTGEDVRNELACINAQSRFDGMILGIRNAIDEKVSVSNQYITNLTHQDGNVYDVTLAADEKRHVFPISGSIVVDENGIIDRKQSDSRFIVRDDAGKIEMRSVDDLYKLESSDNADVLKEATAQSIREQESARHAEEIETPSEEEKAEEVASVQPGDVISLDMQGIKATATVQSKRDGSTVLLFDEPIEYDGKKSQTIELSDEQVRAIIIPENGDAGVLVENPVLNEEVAQNGQNDLLENAEGIAVDATEAGPIEGTALENIPVETTFIENVPIQEGIVAQSIEPEVPQENQAVVIPVDKKGNKVYHKAPVEVSLQDMRAYGLDDVETDGFVNAQKVEAGKRIEKLEKNKPKVGTNLEKYQADKKAWADELVDAQAQVEYWNEVEAQVLAIRKKPGDTTAAEITSMGEPMNGSELAAMMLGNGKIPLLYGDYKKETGFKDKEASGMFGTFASKENGGLTIEQAGEQLMLADQEAGTNFFDQEDANAGRNVILDVLSSARTRGDLTGYISKGREAMAERERQAEYEAYEGWCDDTFHMAVEEYEAYEGGIAEDLAKRSLSEDEYNEFMSAFVDELKLNSNEQQGVNGESEGSGSVLHGEELIQTGRTGGIEEESTKVDGGFVDENGFVSESASSGEVDRQGNPIDGQGNLLIDRILNVSDISDYDFISPARNIGLPSVSKNVSDVLGSGEKQIIIKKNILEKNRDNHPEITPDKSRDILQNALYSPTLVGQAQPVKRPNYWVAIETSDKNSVVVLEVNENKDNVEIVGWRLVDRKGLEKLKRQAEREGGQFLIQTSNNDAAAALSTLPSDLSSVDKDSELQLEKQEKEGENYFVAPDHLNGESLFDYAERVASSAGLNNGKVTQRDGSILSLDEFLENRPFVNGYLYHGSPDGDLNMIDPFAHSQNWKEGIGFYTTESRDAAQMYADGRTAKGERKSNIGKVNYIKPNPDARILDMDVEMDVDLWKGIADNMDMFSPMEAKTNGEAYRELIEMADDPEAQYAIEEALLANGYDASTHMEGKNGSPHRVTIWKNPDKLPMIARPEDVYSESLPKMDEERFDSNEANDILRQVQGESILDYAERVVKANEITQEREKVNMNPTNAQKEAGNYKKGHVGIDGFDITIENPRGSERSGVDATGETWSITMNNDYGYIRGTVGVDGDHIDVFLSDDPTQGDVFVVDQVKEDGSFDEHKVMYGFTSMDEAKEAYLSNYSPGWEGLGNITGVSKDVFKEWIDSSHRKTKPFPEYKIVQERTEAKPDNNAQYENDSNIRFREDGEMESQESRYATMKELVDHLNEVTGRPTVMAKNADDLLSILESEGIEEWVIRDIRDTFDRAEMENVKFPGFFDSETGKVYLCADQISDLDTLRSSWAHEFNHLATSSVFANNELNDLYDVIGEDGIRGVVPAYYFEEGLSKSMIADEYLSRLMGELASDTEIFDELQNGNIDGLLEDLEFPNDRIIPYISKNLKFIFNGKEEDNRENGSKDGVVDSGRNETSGENQKDTGTEQFRKSESGTERGESRDEISSSVESLCKDLNTLVRIVRDVNKLTDSDRDMLKRKRRSKGWFDPKTSEVAFVLPNAESIEDAVATVLHEVVAHKGLREMFGKDFDGFLDNVYGGVSKEIRTRINRMAQKHGFDTRIATEEYLASLAERGFEDVHEKSAWEKIKELFSDMLRRVGVKFSKSLSDEDLRYILWKSMNHLKDGDSIVDKAEKIAKDREVSDRLFRFREEDTEKQENEGVARLEYESALDKTNNKMYQWQEAYQDSMLGLKKMQEAIEQESESKLQHFEDAYMAENQMSSKSAFETEVYKDKFLVPMLDAIKRITDRGISRDRVNIYVMAKHGLERNVVFAKRDAEKAANEKFDEKISDVYKSLDKGDISHDEWEEKIEDLNAQKRDFYEEQYIKNRMRDYSGLTQLAKKENEEEKDYEAVAKGIVDQFEEKFDTKELWGKIDLATKQTLKKSYESGLMTRGTYEKVKNMFEFYVPLRGWNDDVASDVYEYMLSERSIFQAPVKAALGRKSLADDPFANIGNMAESGILQGNRNLMKQKFLNMVLNHPTSLATVKTMWYERVVTGDKEEWVESFPEIREGATPDEIAKAIEDHEAEMVELEKNRMATKSTNKIKLDYRASTREKDEHMVVVKNGGKEYVIYVNGNPRAAQAINGLTNPDATDHKLMQLIGKLNRQLAANFTTRNPAFVLSNMSRDVIFSTSAVWVKEDWEYAKRFDKNIIKNIGAIAGLMARYKSGKLDMSNSRDRHFLEFLENGGETGYTALHNVDEYKKMMDRHVKKSNGAWGSVGSGVHVIVDAVSFMNRCAENVSRFTTYQTSRELGRGISESVRDAKEVTVNFNKKGAGGLGAGTFKSLFLFFNAAVQSLKNFQDLYGKSKSKFYTAIGGFAAAGILMPMINNAIIEMLVGNGDDEMTDEERAEWMGKKGAYDNLPEWVRKNNLCLWVGGERFVTIPLPIELRAFYGLGEMWYQMGRGNMNGVDGKIDVKKASFEMVNQLTELLPINPMGGNGDALSVIVPDAGKPLYQVFANRDFFGKPIYKEGDYNELMPAWTKAYNGTAKWMVGSAEFINKVSGGDKYTQGEVDLNPATIEHVFEGYLGGMGKTANQLYKTLSMIWDEDERMWRNVPVANRFISGSDNKIEFRKVNEAYYQCMDELKETEQRLRGYENEAEMGIEEYAKKYDFLNESKEYERYQIMKEYKSVIDDLRKVIKESDLEEKKEIEMETNLLKMEMLDELKNIK